MPLRSSLAVALVLLAAGAAAQERTRRPDPPPDRAERARELETAREDQRRAAEAEARLKAEIERLRTDRVALNRTLIETAARVRDVEGRLAASEARLPKLDADEARIRRALDGRRALLADLLAVLQRMGRRPPPALVTRPEDVLAAVRSAMLVGTLLPEVRLEAQALAGDLAELVRLRQDIATEREKLTLARTTIAAEQTRLAALVEERQRREREQEAALDGERARARDLARQVESLEKLIAGLEAAGGPAARAADEAAKAAPERRGNAMAALRDAGRMAPALPFAQAKGLLPLPVNGVRLREFGDRDRVGGSERGLSIATRSGAQVTAPCDGWVVFAGPFRSYGQLLIINAGGGYHVLLAGMDRISVQLGQFVLTGEPVAVMGGGPQAVSLVSIGSSQPVLYVEFRKDGVSVDPGPWWAATDMEKVRG